MSRFTSLLKRIDDRLKLPQPTKSRILLEIAADLEDLYLLYLERGLGEQEAALLAEEKFDFSDDALQELTQVHQTFYRKLLDRISVQAQTRWERIVLLLTILFIAAFGAKVVLTSQFIMNASRFVWPILMIFFASVFISLPKFYQLYLGKDHTIKKLHAGLNSILYLGAANLFLGIFGFTLEQYSAGPRSLFFITHLGFLMNTYSVESHNTLMEFTRWMMRTSSMVVVCIFVTILTALIWYALVTRITKIEQAEAMMLLDK